LARPPEPAEKHLEQVERVARTRLGSIVERRFDLQVATRFPV